MAINNPVITDSGWLQATAVAIQNKDGGGKIEVPDFASRIEAIPTGSNFDMTVTDNKVKMVIEVNDYDLSYWTRFGISGGGTVTVDWGDGTVDEYTGNISLEYAPQRKHNYQKAGRYLITETIVNGTLTIGSINSISTLSEGELSNDKNSQDSVRYMYNYKLKELAFGENIIVKDLMNIPCLKLHNDVYFAFNNSATDYITIKEGVQDIIDYFYSGALAYIIKIPSTITRIRSNAFSYCKVRIIDFTSIQLNESNELPFTVSNSNAFVGSNSTILLFATQEIAEVAKNTTNLSVYVDRIKYVGEV